VICSSLLTTNHGANQWVFIAFVVLALLASGRLMLVARRSSDRGTGVAASFLALLVIGAAASLAPLTAAHAPGTGCTSAQPSLSITQTSTIDDLAPGRPPGPITGTIVTNGETSTYIASVTVQITSVTLAPGVEAGACAASDYTLVNALMPVKRMLRPGQSVPFSGASIGFASTTANQDACQGAVVQLLYTANSR
jgi:hypothetical protein